MVVSVISGRYIAVAVAALLLLMLVVAFMVYTRRARTDDDLRDAAERAGNDTKVCPDCASEIGLEARACQHCGYKFA